MIVTIHSVPCFLTPPLFSPFPLVISFSFFLSRMANDNSIFESQPAKKSKTATKDVTENGPKSTRCKTRSRTLKKNQTEQDFPIEGSQSTPEKLSSPNINGVASSTEEINGNVMCQIVGCSITIHCCYQCVYLSSFA